MSRSIKTVATVGRLVQSDPESRHRADAECTPLAAVFALRARSRAVKTPRSPGRRTRATLLQIILPS
eukprot:1726328-Pleurochrysis_carterae.AAC.1